MVRQRSHKFTIADDDAVRAPVDKLLSLGHSYIPERTRYASAMVMALVTMACSWYGHSSTPGKSIYLKEA
jgi:hypothetical protein